MSMLSIEPACVSGEPSLESVSRTQSYFGQPASLAQNLTNEDCQRTIDAPAAPDDVLRPKAEDVEIFRQLLRIELRMLRRRGLIPIREHYLRRFSQYTSVVKKTWQEHEEAITASRETPPNEDSRTIVSVTLTVQGGPDDGATLPLFPGNEATIGRGSNASLRVANDKTVSREHVRLEVNDQRLKLTDLSSRNGTRVNLLRAAAARIYDGDVIRLGATRIRVRIYYQAT
jgi:hypothetical protein